MNIVGIDIPAAAAWIFGGGLAGFVTFVFARWQDLRRAGREDRDEISHERSEHLQVVSKENLSLREENDRLRDENTKQKIDLAQIQILLSAGLNIEPSAISIELIRDLISMQGDNLLAVTDFVESFPMLVWFKRRMGEHDYVMMQVSNEYARKYLGRPASFYRGKRDAQIWPKETADAFAKNDEASYRSGGTVQVLEPVKSPLTNIEGWFRGIKWAFELDGEIYVCGAGVHENHKDDQTPFTGSGA